MASACITTSIKCLGKILEVLVAPRKSFVLYGITGYFLLPGELFHKDYLLTGRATGATELLLYAQLIVLPYIFIYTVLTRFRFTQRYPTFSKY